MEAPDTDQDANPFTSRGNTPSFAHCIWEALKDRPDGLGAQDIANVMQKQGLRDMSHLKSAASQVLASTACRAALLQIVIIQCVVWKQYIAVIHEELHSLV